MNRQQRRAGKKQGGNLPPPPSPPPFIEGLLLQASRLHETGRLPEAARLYQQILQLDSRHADALHRLGVAAHQMGRTDMALDLVGRAIEQDGRHPGYHVDLGNMLLERGRAADAALSYRRALKLQPGLAIAHFNLGNALRAEGRLDQALTAYAEAAAHQPDFAEAHNNQGLAAQALGRLETAEIAFAMALVNRPTYAEAHGNLGLVQLDRGRIPQAAGCFHRALALQPALAEAHNGLGNVLKCRDRLDEAESAFGRALAVRPSYADAHHNLGLTLKEQGRPRDAVAAYDRAIHHAPDLGEARFAQSLALLQLGAWPDGWRHYESRWAQKSEPAVRLRRYPQPVWQGEPAAGRTILLWVEQGFGDTIQFVRFAREMTRRGWNVVLEVQRELARLVATVPDVTVVPQGTALPPFDVHCPIMGLPGRLGITLDNLPAGGCLRADGEAAQHWRTQLSAARGFKVGIVWRGSPGHKRDRSRSMAPAVFGEFLDQPGIEVVSLQKDGRPEELASLPADRFLCDAGPELGDFADTAALVAALDLVISVDTSVLHLAAALGAPCWGLIDFAPDWRWLTARGDSPWYPSLRLFRQPRRGDWRPVIAAVRAELGNLAERRAAS
ncbi:MAG TPA: tetratricopeptide repeat-containing glycosyltransferase family protein [Magnetospirillaceae bacterium]|nr:tetratricopeptide repeat-containing glycosyltransferase family protein [Magnetospirillaceae bacterium]